MIAPRELASRAEAWLQGLDSVTNVVRLPGAAVKPPGDVLLCDVARENGSVILAELRRMKLDAAGTIAVESGCVALGGGGTGGASG